MKRWKKHTTNFNRMQRDDRIPPSRRILAEVLALWIDADDSTQVLPNLTEKQIVSLVLLGTFGLPERIWWKDDGEADTGGKEAWSTKLDNESREQIKTVFDEILGEARGQ